MNPRRPTPSGPEPDPFDQARAPPHSLLLIQYVNGLLAFSVIPTGAGLVFGVFLL